MKRRIFNAIAVVSALLCVATVVLWVRSYWTAIEVVRGHTAHGWYSTIWMSADSGRLVWSRSAWEEDPVELRLGVTYWFDPTREVHPVNWELFA